MVQACIHSYSTVLYLVWFPYEFQLAQQTRMMYTIYHFQNLSICGIGVINQSLWKAQRKMSVTVNTLSLAQKWVTLTHQHIPHLEIQQHTLEFHFLFANRIRSQHYVLEYENSWYFTHVQNYINQYKEWQNNKTSAKGYEAYIIKTKTLYFVLCYIHEQSIWY